MMKITKVDRKVVKVVMAEINQTAEVIGKKYGLKITRKSASFDDLQITTRVEFAVLETADGKTPEQVEFEKYANLYNLEPSDFGKQIEYNGATFKIVGLNTKASKNNIIIKRMSDGKQFVSPDDVVAHKLGRKVKKFGIEVPELNMERRS